MEIIRKLVRSSTEIIFALVLCTASGLASAEIIDDIKLKSDANGELDAYITFTLPIQHLRYFPPKKSQYLVIYFNIVDSISQDQWRNYVSHNFPPSGGLVTKFTATTRDLTTGPKIEIQFIHPVEFSIKAGRDGRSLHIHIKPGQPLQIKETTSIPSGAAIVPPTVAATITATQNMPLPEASAGITTQSSIPSGITAKTPQPPTSIGSRQLGGKDGLPPFPLIDQVTQEVASAPQTGELTLADQIKKANNDAAVQMAKGRDALLAGQMFAAIEAFNNTLKLPPNKYTQDAQVWIGIAREKSGQPAKAKLEYESYLKLYPDGTSAKWVKGRLAMLNTLLPSPSPPTPLTTPIMVQNSAFQTTAYGSFSMYYYHGASHTDTTTTVGTVQIPTSLTVTDQSSLITNISMTARSFNDVYDNRMVFQDFYSANFLPGQENTNRLSAAFYELRNRFNDYSARLGRQSALGGGVLGRFDGVSAGFGFLSNWRANAVAGQLSDQTYGSKPVFFGAGLDFGVKSSIGGQVYVIKQTVDGLTDRQAVGGNLRYFDQKKTALALLDYDTQFKALNMFTLQGTINDISGTDYNFLFDWRKTPTLSIRNAVNGTTASIDTLLQNGWTVDDLLSLAKQRTATTSLGQFGLTNHIREKWQIGTDFSVSNTSGLPASGTLNPDFTTGLEGFVPATPSTGIAWTLSERVIGSDLISRGDVSVCSLSYTKSTFIAGTSLLLNNHSVIRELWTLDSTLRFYWQSDSQGGRENIVAPTLKLGYRVKNSLLLETEGGVEWTNATPSSLPASNTNRTYISVGFRWDF